MYVEKWKPLERISSRSHKLNVEPDTSGYTCRVSKAYFTHVAFDTDDGRLIAVDSQGNVFYVDLSHGQLQYRKLRHVGSCTFLAFNPIDKSEILVGLTTSCIKIYKLQADDNRFCLLKGHRSPPRHVSFYKYYCLTSSAEEAIIWHLDSCCRIHQLRSKSPNLLLRKAAFSNSGLIATLYQNGTIQAWALERFDRDTKIDTCAHGIRNVKDFDFTRDGRALIVCGSQSRILVFDTFHWNILRDISLPDIFIGAKRSLVVPQALDGGANKIVALLSSKCTLRFLDLQSCCFLESSLFNQSDRSIRDIAVSPNGRYLAVAENQGCLLIANIENALIAKPVHPEKAKAKCRPRAHRLDDHLGCVRQGIKEELRLRRMIPILKEFGEYPNKYRTIIWPTILKLPANRAAFVHLANEITRENTAKKMLKEYPLEDQSKASLLSVTIDCLVRWCPRLAQLDYLPRLIFPFLVVFQKNHLQAFEVVLCLLLNYCQKWFEYHPLPPFNVLGVIENILLEADPYLLMVFCERGITSSEYAWPLLQTAMSEVLSGDEWLILWDHLWSFRRPSLFLTSVIAYSICARETIISTIRSIDDFRKFYRTQGHVPVKDLLKVAHRLDHEIPLRIHPSRYFRNKVYALPREGPYPPFLLHEYPEVLTEESRLTENRKLQEREEELQEHHRHVMRLADEKRIRADVESFVNEIHQARMNEVRRCYGTQREAMSKTSECECASRAAKSNAFGNWERERPRTRFSSSEDYKRLRYEVDKLESEVKTLIGDKR